MSNQVRVELLKTGSVIRYDGRECKVHARHRFQGKSFVTLRRIDSGHFIKLDFGTLIELQIDKPLKQLELV